MIKRKLHRPKKEPKVGLTLRLDETEFSFLHEVKSKRGCTIAAYIRFLIHRSTYEEKSSYNKKEQKIMESVVLLMNQKKLIENYRLLITQSEHNELERIKLKTGVSYNMQIRWLIRRRIAEFRMLGGELFEIV